MRSPESDDACSVDAVLPGRTRPAPEPPDPIAAYRELAAVLIEIKEALGPDALLDRPLDYSVVDELADDLDALDVPEVPFAVSIVPDHAPEPLQPVDEAKALTGEDLVPHHRPHRLSAPRFGRRP